MKHKNLKKSKPEYANYRQNLAGRGISSYKDQFGKQFTTCGECVKKDCPARPENRGCMAGSLKPELKELI